MANVNELSYATPTPRRPTALAGLVALALGILACILPYLVMERGISINGKATQRSRSVIPINIQVIVDVVILLICATILRRLHRHRGHLRGQGVTVAGLVLTVLALIGSVGGNFL